MKLVEQRNVVQLGCLLLPVNTHYQFPSASEWQQMPPSTGHTSCWRVWDESFSILSIHNVLQYHTGTGKVVENLHIKNSVSKMAPSYATLDEKTVWAFPHHAFWHYCPLHKVRNKLFEVLFVWNKIYCINKSPSLKTVGPSIPPP